MPRIRPIERSQASGPAETLLNGVERKLGKVPNFMRTLAHSSAALEAYLGFSNTLAKGTLSAKEREQIALAVSEANGCGYCLAAHSAIGKSVGLSEEEVTDARRGRATERRAEAVLQLANEIVSERGYVRDDTLESARQAGLSDGDIIEVSAMVGLTIFTNYANHVADTEVDFPAVPGAASAQVCACT